MENLQNKDFVHIYFQVKFVLAVFQFYLVLTIQDVYQNIKKYNLQQTKLLTVKHKI